MRLQAGQAALVAFVVACASPERLPSNKNDAPKGQTTPAWLTTHPAPAFNKDPERCECDECGCVARVVDANLPPAWEKVVFYSDLEDCAIVTPFGGHWYSIFGACPWMTTARAGWVGFTAETIKLPSAQAVAIRTTKIVHYTRNTPINSEHTKLLVICRTGNAAPECTEPITIGVHTYTNVKGKPPVDSAEWSIQVRFDHGVEFFNETGSRPIGVRTRPGVYAPR